MKNLFRTKWLFALLLLVLVSAGVVSQTNFWQSMQQKCLSDDGNTNKCFVLGEKGATVGLQKKDVFPRQVIFGREYEIVGNEPSKRLFIPAL